MMNTKTIIYTLFILALTNQALGDTKTEERVKKYVKVRIEDFYRDYISISEDKDAKSVEIAKKKIIKEYLTPEFINQLETQVSVVEQDPILLQQGWGKDYANKISLTDFDIQDKDHAEVTVTLGKHPQDDKNPGPAVLRLKVVKIKDKWKIESITKDIPTT